MPGPVVIKAARGGSSLQRHRCIHRRIYIGFDIAGDTIVLVGEERVRRCRVVDTCSITGDNRTTQEHPGLSCHSYTEGISACGHIVNRHAKTARNTTRARNSRYEVIACDAVGYGDCC